MVKMHFLIKILIFALIICPASVLAVDIPSDDIETLPDLINTVFSVIFGLAGIAIFVVLIIGGLSYLTAGGSPMLMAKARQRIIMGLVGFGLIFGSYLIINQINPDILRGIFTPWDIDSPEPPDPPQVREPDTNTYVYQEIPFGTILETKILAKNITCYEGGELVDCHTGEPILEEEIERIIYIMGREFPDIWGEATKEDAELAYLCYDFDDQGNFTQTDPIGHNDRLDCIRRVVQAFERKSRTLNERVLELKTLTSSCSCGQCECGECAVCEDPEEVCGDPEECDPDDEACLLAIQQCWAYWENCSPCDPAYNSTCPCGQACDGDPCEAQRAAIDAIRQQLNMDQIVGGHNLLQDNELVKVLPENYDEMTLINQVRYLANRFFPPHIASLEIDLSYLVKARNMYQDQCLYGTHLSQANFMDLVSSLVSVPYVETEVNKFCLNGSQARWGESCPEEQQVKTAYWCHEFNCTDCDEEGAEKLACGVCNLDVLEEGTEVPFTRAGEDRISYKCSQYYINQQDGELGREVDDELGVMCRIQSDGELCQRSTGNPVTFYCPQPGSNAPVETTELSLTREFNVDHNVVNGYRVGYIELGQLIDSGRAYIDEIKRPLIEMVKDGVPKITCPSFDKNDPDNLCLLYLLPTRCICNGVIQTMYEPDDESFCGISCDTWHGCLCNNCEEPCDGCLCSTCLPTLNNPEEYQPYPCPQTVIDRRQAETINAYGLIKKQHDTVVSLIRAVGLADNQPSRTEMFNQLQDSQKKLQRCVSGFQVDYAERTVARAVNCRYLLDNRALDKWQISPFFETCYPYNSERLTPQQRDACRADRNSQVCLSAIRNLMFDYFCLIK